MDKTKTPPADCGEQAPDLRRLPGRVLAAPSWVMPGTVAQNCAFLAGVVDEVGLLFMESAACLAYTEHDIPASLADLSLAYHVHLPLDLPMDEPERAARICARLLAKTAHLPPAAEAKDSAAPAMRAVLHPPPSDPAQPLSSARRLAAFAECWLDMGENPGQFLLENTRDNDLTELTDPIHDYGFAICLDMGHAMAYGQEKLLRRQSLLRQTRMLHVNAPGRGKRAGAHLSLTSLDESGRTQAERICKSVPDDAVIMMEFFSWRLIVESLPLLREWL